MTDKNDTHPTETTRAVPVPVKDTDGKSSDSKSGRWVGAAVGIGSAAIVAALLYSNRKK